MKIDWTVISHYITQSFSSLWASFLESCFKISVSTKLADHSSTLPCFVFVYFTVVFSCCCCCYCCVLLLLLLQVIVILGGKSCFLCSNISWFITCRLFKLFSVVVVVVVVVVAAAARVLFVLVGRSFVFSISIFFFLFVTCRQCQRSQERTVNRLW